MREAICNRPFSLERLQVHVQSQILITLGKRCRKLQRSYLFLFSCSSLLFFSHFVFSFSPLLKISVLKHQMMVPLPQTIATIWLHHDLPAAVLPTFYHHYLTFFKDQFLNSEYRLPVCTGEPELTRNLPGTLTFHIFFSFLSL